MENNYYELLYMYRQKDEYSVKALFSAMGKDLTVFLRAVSQQYYYAVSMYEDLEQEAYIALNDACETYREDRDCGFRTFAMTVIKRRIWSILRYYGKKGYRDVNFGVPLDEMIAKNEDISGNGTTLADPEYRLYFILALEKLRETVGNLSKNEQKILLDWMENVSGEVAAERDGIKYTSYAAKLRKLKNKIRCEIGADKRNRKTMH